MRVFLVRLIFSITGFLAGFAAFYPGWKKAAPLGDGSDGSFKQIARQISEDHLLARTSAKERVGWLLEICRQPAGLGRDHALYEAIQAMQPADFFSALADLPSLGVELAKMETSVRENLIQAAMEHWLEVDKPGALRALQALDGVLASGMVKLPAIGPKDAMAFYALLAKRDPQWLFERLSSPGKKPQRNVAIQAVLKESVQSNPAQARQWLESLRGTGDWGQALSGYIEGLSKSNPTGAMDLAIAEFKEDKILQGRAMTRAYSAGIAGNPSASSALLDKFNPSQRSTMAWGSLSALDEKIDALGWLQEQVAAHPEMLTSNTGDEWYSLDVLVKRDPARTMQWLDTLPISERAPLTGIAIRTWSQLDPPAALAWLTAQSAESLPGNLSNIGACAISDPQHFETWRESLPPGEMRDRAGLALANEFARQGRFPEAQRYFPRDGASDWFLTSTRQLAKTMAEADMPAAKVWASQMTPGPAQTKAVLGVLDRSAPADAAQWVQTFAPGETRDFSMRALAMRFSTVDPGTGILWLDQIDDSVIWEEGVSDLYRTWSSQDPGRAREWLNQLPGVDDQLKAKLLRRRQ